MPQDVRMRGFRERTDLADLLHRLDTDLKPLGIEPASIFGAAGRILAEPVIAPHEVPRFARAAMDGYALRGEETFGASAYHELTFRLVGQALPAAPSERPVLAGEAVRIMTGAPLPAGANAVVMAEYAREDGAMVAVSEAVTPGKNVSQVGEDIAAGSIVLAPPRKLRPQDVAVCAAAGIAVVAVYRRPRVSLLVTGNELVPPGVAPARYQTVDTNSILLRALLERDGAVVEGPADAPTPILPDDRDALRRALEQAIADCILVTGGSSVGQEDYAPSLIAELGELRVHGLALRPASPAGYGVLDGRPVFLMPGNPVSCLCAYDLFVGHAIRRLGGRPFESPYAVIERPLATKITSAVGRVDYVRVRLTDDGQVEPLAIGGAAILSSTTRADGFVVVPKDLEGYPVRAMVAVHCYDRVLW